MTLPGGHRQEALGRGIPHEAKVWRILMSPNCCDGRSPFSSIRRRKDKMCTRVTWLFFGSLSISPYNWFNIHVCLSGNQSKVEMPAVYRKGAICCSLRQTIQFAIPRHAPLKTYKTISLINIWKIIQDVAIGSIYSQFRMGLKDGGTKLHPWAQFLKFYKFQPHSSRKSSWGSCCMLKETK